MVISSLGAYILASLLCVHGLTIFLGLSEINDLLYIYIYLAFIVYMIFFSWPKKRIRSLTALFYLSVILLYMLLLVGNFFYEHAFQKYLQFFVFSISIAFLITQFSQKDFVVLYKLLIFLALIISLLVFFGVVVSPASDFRTIYVQMHGEESKNYLFVSLYLVVAAASSLVIFEFEKKKIYIFLMMIFSLAAVLSHNRTSIVSLVLFIVLFVLIRKRNKIKLWHYGVLFMPFVLVFWLGDKLLSKFSEGEVGARGERWSYWIERSFESFPAGGGLGVWAPEHPHNLFIQLLAEGGYPAFILSILIFFIPFIRAVISISTSENYHTQIVSLGYFFVFLEYSKSHEIHSGFVFWVFWAIMIAGSYNVRLRSRLAFSRC